MKIFRTIIIAQLFFLSACYAASASSVSSQDSETGMDERFDFWTSNIELIDSVKRYGRATFLKESLPEGHPVRRCIDSDVSEVKDGDDIYKHIASRKGYHVYMDIKSEVVVTLLEGEDKEIIFNIYKLLDDESK